MTKIYARWRRGKAIATTTAAATATRLDRSACPRACSPAAAPVGVGGLSGRDRRAGGDGFSVGPGGASDVVMYGYPSGLAWPPAASAADSVSLAARPRCSVDASITGFS